MTDLIKKIQNLQYIYDDNDPVKRKELINHLTRDKKEAHTDSYSTVQEEIQYWSTPKYRHKTITEF